MRRPHLRHEHRPTALLAATTALVTLPAGAATATLPRT